MNSFYVHNDNDITIKVFIGKKKVLRYKHKFIGTNFQGEKVSRGKKIGINFRECPITTHFVSNKLSHFPKVNTSKK